VTNDHDATERLDRLLHDLKQPLNLVRVIAQDVRLDQRKARLDPATLPDRMLEIERAVDDVVQRLEGIRALLGAPEPAEPST
jgi:hypothetical protein